MKFYPPILTIQGYGSSAGTRGVEVPISGEETEVPDAPDLKMEKDYIEQMKTVLTKEQMNDVLTGQAHLILKGMRDFDAADTSARTHIAELIGLLSQESLDYQINELKRTQQQLRPPFIVLHTSGLNYTGTDEFYENFNYVTCDIALSTSNAGASLEKEKRFHPFGLVELSKHPFSTFIFRVKKEEDWKEIEEDFIKPQYLAVPKFRIFCIPDTGTIEETLEYTKAAWKIALEHGLRAGFDLKAIW